MEIYCKIQNFNKEGFDPQDRKNMSVQEFNHFLKAYAGKLEFSDMASF